MTSPSSRRRGAADMAYAHADVSGSAPPLSGAVVAYPRDSISVISPLSLGGQSLYIVINF